MLSRSLKSAVAGAAVLGGGIALAQSGLVLLLQGEPGPEGDGAEPGDYYTSAELLEKLPDTNSLADEVSADARYATPAMLPNLSGYATNAQLAAVAESWALIADLATIFWAKEEFPDYTGYLSRLEMEAAYMPKALIPTQDELVYEEDLPDTSAWLEDEEFAANHALASELAELPTTVALENTYLRRDTPLQGAIAAEIQAIIAEEVAHPSCPPDMAAIGDSCIDTHEASLWTVPCEERTAQDSALNLVMDTLPSDFPDNGVVKAAHYACSAAGAPVARHVTWFQAAQACAASHKRLCTNQEWQLGALGTPTSACNTQGGLVPTGTTPGCISSAGVYDMVGNAREMTSEWATAGPVWATELLNIPPQVGWGDAYKSDNAYGVNGTGIGSGALPAIITRGGAAVAGGAAPGPYAVEAATAAHTSGSATGFRCCRRR